jgi:hypothetical protein
MKSEEVAEVAALPWYRRILGVLIFLPNIMPLKSLITAEIFPWAFFYTLRKDLRLSLSFGVFLLYLFGSSLVMLGGVSSLQPLIRALFALMNACMIFFLMARLKDAEFKAINKLFEWVFWANVIVCSLQFVGLFPPFLTSFVKLFIDRFSGTSLGGGRGVTALFAEPSYASIAMHYFFAYYLLIKRIDPVTRKGAIAIVAMIAFDLFVIRSVTGSIMIVIYLASLVKRKTLLKAIFLSGVISVVTLFVMKRLDSLPRSVEVVYDFVANQEYKDPLPILLEQSGFRLISIWSAYRYGLVHPLGSGIGGWPNASVEAMDAIGVPASSISFFATLSNTEFFGVRPTSFGAGIMLETGWIGLLLFGLAFWPYFTKKAIYQNLHSRSLTLMFLFNLFILGTIGDPVPFIIMGLTFRSMYAPEGSVLAPLKDPL